METLMRWRDVMQEQKPGYLESLTPLAWKKKAELVFGHFGWHVLHEHGLAKKEKIIAASIKGGGGPYRWHLATELGRFDEESTHPDLPAIPEKQKDELEGMVVTDKRYVNAAGVIVDLSYNPFVPRPAGGASTKERIAIDRDAQLMPTGAPLSLETTSNLRIATTKQFPRLVIPELGQTSRLVKDDSRRLGMFLEDWHDSLMYYFQWLREHYATVDEIDALKSVDEASELTARARQQHFHELSANMGWGLSGILGKNLNIPPDQNQAWNLSVLGGIADDSDLSELSDPRHAMSGIVSFIRILDNLHSRWPDSPWGSYFQTDHFLTFTQAFLGVEAAQKVRAKTSSIPMGEGFNPPIHLIKIGGILTDQWLESAGYGGKFRSPWQMNDGQLIKYITNTPYIHEALGIIAPQKGPDIVYCLRRFKKSPAASGLVFSSQRSDLFSGLLGDGFGYDSERISAVPSGSEILSVPDSFDLVRAQIDSWQRYLAPLSISETVIGQYERHMPGGVVYPLAMTIERMMEKKGAKLPEGVLEAAREDFRKQREETTTPAEETRQEVQVQDRFPHVKPRDLRRKLHSNPKLAAQLGLTDEDLSMLSILRGEKTKQYLMMINRVCDSRKETAQFMQDLEAEGIRSAATPKKRRKKRIRH